MAEADQGEGGAQRSAGGGNVFTRKLGPAPMWLWMLGGLGAALAFTALRGGKAKKEAPAEPQDTGGTQTASQTPPFIIQNYPGVGVPGPQGPAGATGATGATGPPATPPATPTPPMQGGNPPSAGTPVSLPPKPVTPKAPLEYRVKPGDTLSSIAAKYGTTWQAIWNYNIDPAHGRPASTIATLKQRGPNLLFSNELILIPQ